MEREKILEAINQDLETCDERHLQLVYSFIHAYTSKEEDSPEDKIKREQGEKERAKEREKERFEAMQQQVRKQKERIANLTGADKRLFDKIEKVRSLPNFDRYGMNCSQSLLLVDIFKNSYLDAGHYDFCYGFHQGLQYAKNRAKKG